MRFKAYGDNSLAAQSHTDDPHMSSTHLTDKVSEQLCKIKQSDTPQVLASVATSPSKASVPK